MLKKVLKALPIYLLNALAIGGAVIGIGIRIEEMKNSIREDED